MNPYLIPELIHLTLNVSSLIMHLIGLVLLVSLYHSSCRRKTLHQLLLINLSLSVIVKNTLAVTGSVTGYLFSVNGSELLKIISYYVRLADSSSAFYQYYISIGFIIIDQLLIVILKTRYSTICTIKRCIHSLLATWIISICILGLVVVGDLLATDVNLFLDWLDLYLPSIFDMFFIFFSVTCYMVMFFRFASSQRKESLNRNKKVKVSLLKIFQKSKFYHSVVLVLSSLLLTTIPGLVISGLRITQSEIPDILVYYVIASIGFNYIIDGLIYVFMQKLVRRHFIRMFACQVALIIRNCYDKNIGSANQKSVFEMLQRGQGPESESIRKVKANKTQSALTSADSFELVS